MLIHTPISCLPNMGSQNILLICSEILLHLSHQKSLRNLPQFIAPVTITQHSPDFLSPNIALQGIQVSIHIYLTSTVPVASILQYVWH